MNEAYANFAEGSFSWRFIEQPAFDRALPDDAYRPDARILDIGSGSGRVVNYHIQRGASEANVLGIDPEDASIDMTTERFPQARFIHQKAQNAVLPPRIDITTAVLALRYLDNNDLSRTVERVAKAMAPGALFFMLDAHPDRIALDDGFYRYFQEGWRTIEQPWGGIENYYYRTIGSYTKILRRAGLEITSVDPCPIAIPEGMADEHTDEFANYSRSLARFAVTAIKA